MIARMVFLVTGDLALGFPAKIWQMGSFCEIIGYPLYFCTATRPRRLSRYADRSVEPVIE